MSSYGNFTAGCCIEQHLLCNVKMNTLRGCITSTAVLRRQFQVSSLLGNAIKYRAMASQFTKEQVLHDTEKQEFYLEMGGEKAMLQYTLDGNTYDMYHTFTPPSFRGSGVARLLAYKAFDHVADSGAKMKLTCSYLDHLHNKELNPKYDPHVVKSSSPV